MTRYLLAGIHRNLKKLLPENFFLARMYFPGLLAKQRTSYLRLFETSHLKNSTSNSSGKPILLEFSQNISEFLIDRNQK